MKVHHIKSYSEFVKIYGTQNIINEGGNALNTTQRIANKDIPNTLEYITAKILPTIGLEGFDIDAAVVGSAGKKDPDVTSGDIDIAVSIDKIAGHAGIDVKGVLKYINDTLAAKGYETNIQYGFHQVNVAVPIDGDPKKGYCQVDLMVTDNLDWSKFIYFSPDYRKAESRYSGAFRGMLINAVASEGLKKAVKHDEESGEMEEYEQMVNRATHGLFKVRKTLRGKKGLIKTPKLMKDYEQKISNIPSEVIKILFGDGVTEKDVESFEGIWKVIHSKGFPYQGKLETIANKFLWYMKNMEIPVPTEIVEKYPNLIKENQSNMKRYVKLYEDFSINESHLGDKLYPENADEADGKAITKLLEPYKKKWVNASSMMDNRDFDAALREYIMDFEPEGVKNKKDLVEDFKDYLSAMGYSDTASLEEAKKEYFQTMSPEEFAKIKKGDTVQYMATTMKVISNDGYVLDMKDNRGQNYKANLGQFIHGGRIAESVDEGVQELPTKLNTDKLSKDEFGHLMKVTSKKPMTLDKVLLLLLKDKNPKSMDIAIKLAPQFNTTITESILNEAEEKQGKELVNIMVGRFQPFHNGHYLAAKELHDKNGLPVVLASVRAKGKTGKGTSFTDVTMDKMMKDVIKKSGFIIDNVEIPFVAFDTKLFPALRPKYEPVLFGAGEDRVATYDRQRISMRDKHKNKINMRDDFEIQLTGRYGSGTAVRNAIEKGDQKEFESTMPKFLHNYWDTLSSELGMNENQASLDFSENELSDIADKFMNLDKIKKKGTKYTYQSGTGYLTLDIKGGKIRGAEFSDDRAYDFLKHLEEKGFGPNIFGTLKKLAKDEKMKGYNTILMFESLNELRNDGLLSDVDNIDQILMNTKNRRAARDWEEYTEDLFADYEGEVHQVAFRINSPGGITWADIEDSDIKAAIDVGQDIMNRYKIKESVNEANKIACLDCDEVNTEAKWKKNNGFCPSCKSSNQGVAESSSQVFERGISLWDWYQKNQKSFKDDKDIISRAEKKGYTKDDITALLTDIKDSKNIDVDAAWAHDIMPKGTVQTDVYENNKFSSPHKGKKSGDITNIILKEMDNYFESILDDADHNFTYFKLREKKNVKNAIMMLNDVYGIKGENESKRFAPDSVIRIPNNKVLENTSMDSEIGEDVLDGPKEKVLDRIGRTVDDCKADLEKTGASIEKLKKAIENGVKEPKAFESLAKLQKIHGTLILEMATMIKNRK